MPKHEIWTGLAVIGALAVVIAAVLMLVWPRTYITYNHAICKNNLKMIGLALQHYHDHYGSFPPAYVADQNGKRLHSWRVLILPFLDQGPLYNKYRLDEPWDGPHNSKLHSEMVRPYACPNGEGRGGLNYVAVVGPHLAWGGDKPRSLRDFQDDTETTVMVVERVDSNVHWMEPHDLEIDLSKTNFQEFGDKNIGIRHWDNTSYFPSRHYQFGNALMVGGNVRRLRENLSLETFKAMLTIDGRETVRK